MDEYTRFKPSSYKLLISHKLTPKDDSSIIILGRDGGNNMDWTQAFTIIGVLGGFMFYALNRLETRMESRMDKMESILTDVDRRLCRLEGAFASKDCCMIKDERQMKKAE